MQVRGVANELARADLAEGDAGAVVGVDVGGYLEDEACELRLLWLYVTLLGFRGTGRGSYLNKAVEELLDTEVVEG